MIKLQYALRCLTLHEILPTSVETTWLLLAGAGWRDEVTRGEPQGVHQQVFYVSFRNRYIDGTYLFWDSEVSLTQTHTQLRYEFSVQWTSVPQTATSTTHNQLKTVTQMPSTTFKNAVPTVEELQPTPYTSRPPGWGCVHVLHLERLLQMDCGIWTEGNCLFYSDMVQKYMGWMYVCVYVCMYICITYVCIYICIYVRTYACMYVCSMYVSMYVSMYANVFMYVRMYVYIYILNIYLSMLHYLCNTTCYSYLHFIFYTLYTYVILFVC